MACREEFPHLDRLYRELRDEGFSVVAVDVSNDIEGTRRYYEENGWEVPAAFDVDEVGRRLYGIAGTPTNYLLDADGRIVWRHFGFTAGDEVELRERIEAALREARTAAFS